jgi:superfamily II DNA or RNA helicase
VVDVTLMVNHQKTKVFFTDPQNIGPQTAVDSVCSISIEGAEFSEKFIKGTWDGKHHLFSKWTSDFPTGLLRSVIRSLAMHGFTFDIDDRRTYPDFSDLATPVLTDKTWRDWQLEAIQIATQHENGRPTYPTGVFQAPPGTGKTLMMLGIALTQRQFPLVWTTNTNVLLNQTAEDFAGHCEERNISVSVFGDEAKNPKLDADITISTIQTFGAASRNKNKPVLDVLVNARTLMVDEAHRGAANDYYKMIMKSKAPFRYGCSATPFIRTDKCDKKLVASVGDTVYSLPHKEAVKKGYLVSPNVYYLDYMRDTGRMSTKKKDKMYGTYSDLYTEMIVESEVRNDWILKAAIACINDGRKTLILVTRVKHGKFLVEQLKRHYDYERASVFLSGPTKKTYRDRAVREVNEGKILSMISTTIFDEGFDAPKLEAVILGSGGKSDIKTIQRIGRAMRLCDGKKHPVVFDFIDRSHSALLGHSLARMEAAKTIAKVKRVFDLERCL